MDDASISAMNIRNQQIKDKAKRKYNKAIEEKLKKIEEVNRLSRIYSTHYKVPLHRDYH